MPDAEHDGKKLGVKFAELSRNARENYVQRSGVVEKQAGCLEPGVLRGLRFGTRSAGCRLHVG